MLPGFVSAASCSPGTWCKPCYTMHLRRFFGPTAVLGRSIHILCCCVMDDTNLLHLFRDITKQILTFSLDQHRKIIAQLRDIIFQRCPGHQSIFVYYNRSTKHFLDFNWDGQPLWSGLNPDSLTNTALAVDSCELKQLLQVLDLHKEH